MLWCYSQKYVFILTQFQADLAYGPDDIVAHRNKIWVQVLHQEGKTLGHKGMHMGKTDPGQITKQGKCRLTHL